MWEPCREVVCGLRGQAAHTSWWTISELQSPCMSAMNVDVMDAGVVGGLEVDLVLVALSTELNRALHTPTGRGEAGKLVSERAGLTSSSARAWSGKRSSVAR